MVKKAICFALGGHITTQNASFRKLIQILKPKGFEFFGAENGFGAFETGNTYKLTSDYIPRDKVICKTQIGFIDLPVARNNQLNPK